MLFLLNFILTTAISIYLCTDTTDCLHLREQCINAGNGCESVWNVVEDACNISVLGNRCKAEDTVGCNRIIQVLADEYPEFKNCVCTTDDICSITTLLGKQCSINKVLFFLAYTTNRSCLDVNRECIEDEVCNRQLSLYLKVCSVNKKCNVEGCQAAIRFFYRNMPFEVAQMMIFCDCIQRDESCHRAKELLHGKPCAVTVVPPPSCLNVIRMCEENELCRKKYTTFRAKCWRHVTKKCYTNDACLETLVKDDIPCSANADCKAAYINNWGTVLHTECTCQNLPLVEQPLCELFHHMLHSKSCFSDLRDKAPLCPHALCHGSHQRVVLCHRVVPGLLQHELNLKVHLQPLLCSSCMQTSGPSTRSKTKVFSSQISD
uniref:GDNF family receptor alpha like n=1 Tax=Cyanoderma ruficeps TaxID=181631 RepID=A0A8C3RGG7_9PASS